MFHVHGQDSPLRPAGRATIFDAGAAAHLLRRSGFGATPAEVDRCLSAGRDAAAEMLVNAAPDPALADIDSTLDVVLGGNDIQNLRAWWCLRMLHTKAPFREKLALFLHGHFVSSHRKVQSLRAIHGQIQQFLDGGAGSFRDLAKRIAADAAMLIYLDGARSEKGKPNENFARELMELFTLGRGHYSERDIREAARAFTGWRVDNGRARFFAPAFDGGEKTIFNHTGRFDGPAVVDLCIDHPACAPFLARRILQFFVTPDPPEDVVVATAEALKRERFILGPVMLQIFRSEYFYSSSVRRSLVAAPVDFVIGALRVLGARPGGHAMASAVAEMGQNLLDPPSVKGWDGYKSWIHSSTWIARVNFAIEQTAGAGADFAGLFEGRSSEAVDAVLQHLLQGEVAPGVRARLSEIYQKWGRAGLVCAALTLPEYHCI
jgi:hypothetical protein